MAYLKIFGSDGERTVFLGTDRLVIGRGEDTDVLLKDLKASRHHCAIEPVGAGRFLLRDLGSGNGTRLNGERVETGELRPEDVITVGDTRILFAAEAAAVVAEERRPRSARRRSAAPLWIFLGVAGCGLLVALLLKGSGDRTGDRTSSARASSSAAPLAPLAGPPPGGDPKAGPEPAGPESAGGGAPGEPAPPAPPASPLPTPPNAAGAEEKEAFFRSLEAQCRAKVEAREYARAREIWFFLRGDERFVPLSPEQVKRIVDAMEELEREARSERNKLLEDVTLAEQAHDFARAKELLAAAIPRFRGTSVARSLDERLDFVERAIRLGVKGRPTAAPTQVTVDLRDRLRAILGGLPQRDFAGARASLEALLAETKEEGARAELESRRRECAAVAALEEEAAAELAAGRPPAQPLAKVWRVLSGSASTVRARARGEERDYPWRETPPDLYLALLDWQCAKVKDGALGLAVAAHALGQQTDFLRALERGYGEAALRPALDGFVAARVRNEAPPEGGYVVDAGEILTRREWVDRREQATIAALRAQLAKSAEKIRANAAFAKLARMEERMAKLDAARRHALELIFDEKAYFYPYRGVGRDAEYARVQQEVDRRVDLVREIWDDRASVSCKPTSELERELKSFDEAAAGLRQRLVDVAEQEEAVAWLRGYLGRSFTIRDFWRTPEERETILYSREVMGDNEGLKGDITEIEREQVRVTNEYRLMFGRWAVRLHEKLVKSSRGHCEEMGRLGYFGHFSTTPGRETPFDRMKLEGYQFGASENCIMGQTNPMGAHVGWCHSSGHHRNLLMAGWTEMGTGHSGIHMTQNFGQAPRYGKCLETGAAEVEEAVPYDEEGEGAGEGEKPAEKFDYEGCGG